MTFYHWLSAHVHMCIRLGEIKRKAFRHVDYVIELVIQNNIDKNRDATVITTHDEINCEARN